MKDVITNIKSLLDAFVFSDILKNPPEPYDKDKFDIISAFDNINDNNIIIIGIIAIDLYIINFFLVLI